MTLIEVTPAAMEDPEGKSEKWYVNPANVVLFRPVHHEDGTTVFSELLFVNTLGPQSSLVVLESCKKLTELMNDSLRSY